MVSVKRPGEVVRLRERDRVHHQVEPADALDELREGLVDAGVVGDVALDARLRADGRRELAHARLDALALVGERERRALLGEPPGDRPGERALVGDARHEGDLPVQQTHARRLPDRSPHATDRTYGILSVLIEWSMRQPRPRPAGPIAALLAGALALGAAHPDRLSEAHVALLSVSAQPVPGAPAACRTCCVAPRATRWRVTYTVTGRTKPRARELRTHHAAARIHALALPLGAVTQMARRPGSTSRRCRAGFRAATRRSTVEVHLTVRGQVEELASRRYTVRDPLRRPLRPPSCPSAGSAAASRARVVTARCGHAFASGVERALERRGEESTISSTERPRPV